MYLSGRIEKGPQYNNESEKAFVQTQEYVWRQIIFDYYRNLVSSST